MADVGGEIERAARVVVAVHERYDRRTDARIQPVHHAAQFVRVGLVDKDVLVFEDSGLNGFLGVFFSIDGVYLDDAQRHAQLELVGDLLPERAVAVAPAVERCETCGLRIQSFERFVQLCEYRLVDIFLFVVGVAAGAFGQFVRCEDRRIGNRAVGVGILEQVIRFDDAGYGCEVMLSGGVALFDQPAGVVEYFLHEVLVHAAAVSAVHVVALVREAAVGALEITAVDVDLQVRPELEEVLLAGIAVTHRCGELRLEGKILGVHLVGIGVQLLEIAGATSQQSDRESQCGGVSDDILEFHNLVVAFIRS